VLWEFEDVISVVLTLDFCLLLLSFAERLLASFSAEESVDRRRRVNKWYAAIESFIQE